MKTSLDGVHSGVVALYFFLGCGQYSVVRLVWLGLGLGGGGGGDDRAEGAAGLSTLGSDVGLPCTVDAYTTLDKKGRGLFLFVLGVRMHALRVVWSGLV